MSTRERLFTAALLAAVSAAGACGPLRKNGPPPAIVVFENQSLDQADVYAVRSAGDRIRIGTVLAGRKESLKIPASVLSGDGSVNIVARILASRRTPPSSGVISLRPGERVAVSLPPQENILTVLPLPSTEP
jgi:hypothetical protein